jgi:homoserine kinase
LALSRYLEVSIEPASDFDVEARGVNCESIPRGRDNLILRVAESVAERRSRKLPPFHMTLENQIPLARGLGSSATAIIAGITCYELLTGDRLSEGEIFRYAFEFEPHPDNLAAALYGGLVTAVSASEGGVCVAKLGLADGATPVVVIPDFEVSTEKARKMLPQSYSRADAVYNIQRAAMTIAVLTGGKWPLLRESMRDRIHQPYRASMIPGLEEILRLDIPGLFGVALSGAGPTVFALTQPEQANEVGLVISAVFSRSGVSATPHKLDFDLKGREIR